MKISCATSAIAMAAGAFAAPAFAQADPVRKSPADLAIDAAIPRPEPANVPPPTVNDFKADTAVTAREVLAKVPTPDNAVLLAVSPNQKAIEVVYGSEVKGRGIEEAAPLGVSAAAASFQEGNLLDGLISAIRVLSAGVSPR